MTGTKTAIQLRLVSVHEDGSRIKLNSRQQAAVDALVNDRLGTQLERLVTEINNLTDQLLDINTKE